MRYFSTLSLPSHPLRPHEWDSGLPLERYDVPIAKRFRDEAGLLRTDIRRQFLEVILVPAPEPQHCGHKIRVAVRQNPDWYQDLWGTYSYSPRRRHKPQSRLRRKKIEQTLDDLVSGRDKEFREGEYGAVSCVHLWVSTMRQLIFERLTEGYTWQEEQGMPPYDVQPDPLVMWYFQRSLHPDRVPAELVSQVFTPIPPEIRPVEESLFDDLLPRELLH